MSHQKTKETYSKIDNSYGDDSNQMLYERINFNFKKKFQIQDKSIMHFLSGARKLNAYSILLWLRAEKY